jgi:hypothetical protein
MCQNSTAAHKDVKSYRTERHQLYSDTWIQREEGIEINLNRAYSRFSGVLRVKSRNMNDTMGISHVTIYRNFSYKDRQTFSGNKSRVL